MDYDFSRIDYTLCGITFPNTLKILPAQGPKVQQKFVIGDKNGVIQCLSIKDEEPIIHFKTLPGKPITSVQLTSALGTQSDKVFAASGNEVKGYTRKGKVFLTVETSLSEAITSMCVLGVDLILCSGRTVTHYKDLQECHSYLCEDRVLDLAAFATPNSTRLRLLVLIANKGAVILENGHFITRTVVSSGPSCMAVPPSMHNSEICVFYGAIDGSLGILIYENSVLFSKCLVEGSGLGAIVCMGWFINSNGPHLVVGRNDGSIQVYFTDSDNIADKPRLKYTYFSGEPITSICGGFVSSDETELLAASYSGRIFALRSRRQAAGTSGQGAGAVAPNALASRRIKLESEIARLEKQVANERDKYQQNTRSIFAGLSAPPLLDVQIELSGATFDGWQEANIISAVPLDMLFVYCENKIQMQTDTVAVLSVCSSQLSPPDFLATVRCQAGTRRLWMRMRQLQDQDNTSINKTDIKSSKVLMYALPSGAPRVARILAVLLPALPYYSQHEELDKANEKRCWCELRLKGSFSVAEMTFWLREALSGELPRPASNVAFARKHSFLNTILICKYQRGVAEITSDNVSTIATLRDIFSNCSMQKCIQVDISTDIPNDCCLKSFERIEEKFINEYQRKKDIALKTALSALDLNFKTNEETIVLCEEYSRICETIQDDKMEMRFEEFVDTVKLWYTNWHVLKLYQVHSKVIQELHSALEACRLDDVKNILRIN